MILEATIGVSGEIDELRELKGDPALEEAATKAVRKGEQSLDPRGGSQTGPNPILCPAWACELRVVIVGDPVGRCGVLARAIRSVVKS